MIGKLHLQATNASDSINKFMVFQIMYFSGMCFMYTVFTLFSCYMYYYTDYDNENFKIAAHNSVLWDIFFMSHFTYVMYLCHRLKKVGNYTAVLSNYYVNKCKSVTIQERLHYLSSQVQNNYPQPSCRLFNFDWPYYYTVCFFLHSCFYFVVNLCLNFR